MAAQDASSAGAAHRRRYLDEKAKRLRGGPESTRALQEALAEYLVWYAEEVSRRTPALHQLPKFDSEIAAELGFALREIASGHDHPLFRPIRGRGALPVSHSVRSAQLDAVAYVRACRLGVIADPTPLDTVASSFGVQPGTAKGWTQKYRLDDASITGADPELIEAKMRFSGRHYVGLPGADSPAAIKRRNSPKSKGI